MTLVVRDEVLHFSRGCGCGYVEGHHVMVCPAHKLSPPADVVRGMLIRKPHIRLFTQPFMAVVSYPGKQHQRSFAFYRTAPELYEEIRKWGEPRES